MKIKAGQFKAQCLKLMDQVKDMRQVIIITKYGKPVAKLVPYENQEPERKSFGCMKDYTLPYGDLISPIEGFWDANS